MIEKIKKEFESVFLEGSMPTIYEVLDNREKRVEFINKLFKLYPKCTIISYKCNIPGEVKNNEIISKIFEIGIDYISNSIKNEKWESIYSKKINLKTGPEYFEVICVPPLSVKEKMAYIEEDEVLGRLFDIDVLYIENDNIHYVERREIGYPNRKCFICNNDAKICASRRTHSLSSIYQSMGQLIETDGRIKL